MEDTKDNKDISNNSDLKKLKTGDYKPLREIIGSYKRNIKVDIGVWSILNKLKGKNDTFNDVILGLLKQKTQALGKENIKLIKYSRKTLFIKANYIQHDERISSNRYSLGIEFEYNDVKDHPTDFVLDLKIKKIFFEKQIFNPSEFFGLDSDHKHLYYAYLGFYLKCVTVALEKEFRVHTEMRLNKDFEDIALWRKIYYDNSLSEESFINDIQEPLRLSEQDPSKEKYITEIKNSRAFSIWG